MCQGSPVPLLFEVVSLSSPSKRTNESTQSLIPYIYINLHITYYTLLHCTYMLTGVYFDALLNTFRTDICVSGKPI